jgi:serine/threonine-protein kinase
MASVYLAHDVRHDRRVALKVLRAELAAVIGAERFLAEIRTTAKLQHPGVLPLFDSGVTAGQLFYVMPFVEGESLRHRLDRERQLPVVDAVRIATEVGDALAYAHEQGVIHRDIKPENILLQSGRPVVADFGIALAVQEAGGNRLTQTGLSLGTPQYMSPEQAAGERGVDGRADQYALAAVLYEMLAGEPPFTAPTTQALIAKVMTEEPRALGLVRKSVPEHVAMAVHRALEKVPADRFTTTREFVTALTSESVVSGSRRYPVARSRAAERRWIPIAAGMMFAGAAIGAAVDHAARPRTTETVAAPLVFALEADSGQQFAFVCCGNIFALSPDGRRLAFQAADADSVVRVHVREMDALTSRSLRGTENAHELFFSPDGQQLGFTNGRALKAVDVGSGRVRAVTEFPATGFLGGGTWTADGRIIYAVGNTLSAVAADGGSPTTLVRLDSAKKELQVGGPHVVAGTDLVLFAVERSGREPIIRALWTKSGRTRDVAPGVGAAVDTVHHSLLVVRSDGTVEARRFDWSTGDTTGAAARIGEPVALRSPVFLYAEFAASATGTIVTVTRSPFSSSGQGTLHFIGADGTDVTHTLPFRARRVARPRFSPDGQLVAALQASIETRLTTLFVYDPDRRATTLLPNDGSLISVDWIGSDSIMSIASSGDVFVQSIHGERPRRLGALGGWSNAGQLSVRGDWLVFEGDRDGSNKIGIAHRDSIDHSRILIGSSGGDARPRLSPDGRHIAFLSTREGPASLHVASFPSLADEIVIADGVTNDVRWGRDGALYYTGVDRKAVVVTLDAGAKLRVASKTVTQTVINAAAVGWDVDIGRKRFVYGSDASNNGGPPRLIVTVDALGKR